MQRHFTFRNPDDDEVMEANQNPRTDIGYVLLLTKLSACINRCSLSTFWDIKIPFFSPKYLSPFYRIALATEEF
jgi:hypothetical protein